MLIFPDTTAGDLASRFPQTIRVFQQLGIEFCCDGRRPLGELCQERALSFDDVSGRLAASLSAAPRPRHDWNSRPLSDLTAHLVEAFHEPLRQEVPRLHSAAIKVQRHTDPYKYVLAVVLSELERFRTDLEAHITTTEREIFPLIVRIEQQSGGEDDRIRFDHLREKLQAGHVEAGQSLQILRNVTNRYDVPPGACTTLRTLYQGLNELEHLVRLHAHLENNVLFPRAAALLSAARIPRSS